MARVRSHRSTVSMILSWVIVAAGFGVSGASAQDGETDEARAERHERLRLKLLEEPRSLTPTPTPIAQAVSVRPQVVAERPRLAAGWDTPPEKKSVPVAVPEAEANPARKENLDTVVLDKMVIEEKRDTFVDGKLAEIDARRDRINRDLKGMDDNVLDAVLNHPLLSFMGGYSTEARRAVAERQLDQMGFELQILAAIEAAKTETEKASLRRVLMEIRYGLRQN